MTLKEEKFKMPCNIPGRVLRDISRFSRKNGIRRVILSGSRAKGTHTERSDIDLAVSGGNFDGFYWNIMENVHSLLSFELAWKALQAVLREHGVKGAETGSLREILQLGYKLGFVDDSAVWLAMLKKHNTLVHIYDEDEADEMLLLIRDSFIPAFLVLEETLRNKLREAGDDWG